ncbi:MAG: AAA domain-containing protein [Methylocella sp.]
MRDFEPLPPAALPKRCDLLIAHQLEINEMLALRHQREVLAQAGLSDFLASADKLLLDAGRLQRVFETFVSERHADRIRRTTPALNANGTTLEARRKLFAERDRRKIDVDRNAVKGKLLRVTPAAGFYYGPRNTWTDTALLRNEFAKQRRFTPARDLLSRAGQAIQTLKPCLMMSPLSLAKFLTPGKLVFDVIVIDEASQMQPEDALGGFLRAKQIVALGDPKQLPPADFFARLDEKPSSDDDFEDIDDESILEAC